MGYMRHHAIVVTTFVGDIEEAHAKAVELFSSWGGERADTGVVSEIVGSWINGYHSFFIAPDGSKEGREESENGDKARDEFIAWIEAEQRYLRYVEVQFADDDGVVKVTRSDQLLDGEWRS